MDGWESGVNLKSFSSVRAFHPSHQYRRRRWYRERQLKSSLVNGFFHVDRQYTDSFDDNREESCGFSLALQVKGGNWSMTSRLPFQGSAFGAIRVSPRRWPAIPSKEIAMYEFSYSISPLDGVWGDFSRLLVISSRFLVRNLSTLLVMEIKQCGATDKSSMQIAPGRTIPFHWTNSRLPELICVRVAHDTSSASYIWSGGFDPLTIGVLPLRLRRNQDSSASYSNNSSVFSIKMEAEIRPKTSGTGINISLEEESTSIDGNLFRIENRSPFPIWFAQDGVLANPSLENRKSHCHDGDLVEPYKQNGFALDVPFRQGKYAHRRAASMTELLRVRLGLAPLSSRSGIETTKVISMTSIGATLRLNPSKLLLLSPKLRSALLNVRVLGVVRSDGPSRVLQFW
jgi:hypothetical protein